MTLKFYLASIFSFSVIIDDVLQNGLNDALLLLPYENYSSWSLLTQIMQINIA